MSAQAQNDLKATSVLDYPALTICGVEISSKLSYKEWAHWLDHAKKNDLDGVTVQLAKASADYEEEGRDNELAKKGDLLESLNKSYNNLRKKLENDFLKFTDDDWTALDKLPDRIAAVEEDIRKIAPPPEKRLEFTNKHIPALEEPWRKRRAIHFEYVYWLAKTRDLTVETLKMWQDRADNEDYTKAVELVELGKRQHEFGGKSKARELQERARLRTLN